MHPLLRITRPGNVLLSALALLAAGFVAVGPEALPQAAPQLALAAGAAMLCVGGGNTLNDWFDRETDRANHPNRVLPRGELSPQTALNWARLLLLAGLLSAGLLLDNPLPLTIAAVAVALLLAYELRLKATGLPGNTTVGLLAGGLFFYGGAATGTPGATLWLAGLATLATLSRELMKDVQDLEGDSDRRTLPARIGPAATLQLATTVLTLAAVLSITAYAQFSGRGATAYLVLVILADGWMLNGCRLALSGDPRVGQQALKQGMGVAMLAFIAGAAL